MASMTILSRNSAESGRASLRCQGIASSTTSPRRAESTTVAAQAWPPSSLTSGCNDIGPRELLIATSWPAATKSRAATAPILPAPMMPIFMVLAPLQLGFRVSTRLVRSLCGLGQIFAVVKPVQSISGIKELAHFALARCQENRMRVTSDFARLLRKSRMFHLRTQVVPALALLAALGCGGASFFIAGGNGQLLVVVSVHPNSADAIQFPNGQVPFTAQGTFKSPASVSSLSNV